MAYKIAVSGSRRYPGTKSWLVQQSLTAEYAKHNGDVLFLFGDCKTGVDFITKRVVKGSNFPYKEFEADWDLYGKAAGPIRNEAMLDFGANELIAFPDSKSIGTMGCCVMAKKKDIPVYFPELEFWHKWAVPLATFREDA